MLSLGHLKSRKQHGAIKNIFSHILLVYLKLVDKSLTRKWYKFLESTHFFTSDVPTCQDPGDILHSYRSGFYPEPECGEFPEYGWISFTCDHGYHGGGTITCGNTGWWTPNPFPTCTSDNGYWTPNPFASSAPDSVTKTATTSTSSACSGMNNIF